MNYHFHSMTVSRVMQFSTRFREIRAFMDDGGRADIRVSRYIRWWLWLLVSLPPNMLEALLLARRVDRVSITPPLIILGHWRSGTTFLQELLSAVPGYEALNIYQALFPGSFLLSEAWMKPMMQVFSNLSGGRNHFQRTHLDFSDTAEEDLALLHMVCRDSGLWDKIYGRMQRTCLDSTEWTEDHQYLLRKLSVRYPGRIMVLKSAQNTWRIRSLLELYPDASFIYLHRNPVEVFRSMMWLWSVNARHYAISRFTRDKTQENVIADYRSMISCYLRDRDLIPRGRLVEVALDEVSARPCETLARIGSILGHTALQSISDLPVLSSQARRPRPDTVDQALPIEHLRSEWHEGFRLHGEILGAGGIR